MDIVSSNNLIKLDFKVLHTCSICNDKCVVNWGVLSNGNPIAIVPCPYCKKYEHGIAMSVLESNLRFRGEIT